MNKDEADKFVSLVKRASGLEQRVNELEEALKLLTCGFEALLTRGDFDAQDRIATRELVKRARKALNK